jgi:hypothetical protein
LYLSFLSWLSEKRRLLLSVGRLMRSSRTTGIRQAPRSLSSVGVGSKVGLVCCRHIVSGSDEVLERCRTPPTLSSGGLALTRTTTTASMWMASAQDMLISTMPLRVRLVIATPGYARAHSGSAPANRSGTEAVTPITAGSAPAAPTELCCHAPLQLHGKATFGCHVLLGVHRVRADDRTGDVLSHSRVSNPMSDDSMTQALVSIYPGRSHEDRASSTHGPPGYDGASNWDTFNSVSISAWANARDQDLTSSSSTWLVARW